MVSEFYHLLDEYQLANMLCQWKGLAQLFIGAFLANWLGRLWAMRVGIVITIIGVIVQVIPNTFGVLILGRLLAYGPLHGDTRHGYTDLG